MQRAVEAGLLVRTVGVALSAIGAAAAPPIAIPPPAAANAPTTGAGAGAGAAVATRPAAVAAGGGGTVVVAPALSALSPSRTRVTSEVTVASGMFLMSPALPEEE